MPTPSATRNTVVPRLWMEGGASGSFLMGIASSRPARHTRSSGGGAVTSAPDRGSAGELDVSTTDLPVSDRLLKAGLPLHSSPAERAQRYLAPSTVTGFSVVYG